MNHSDFKLLRGWIDIDRPQLTNLTQRQKVLYFRKRLSVTLTKPMDDLYRDMLTHSNYSSLLIWGTSICCSIESLGKFRAGGSVSCADRFYGFIDNYMDPRYTTSSIGNLSYKKVLWKHFRNGLAHGFTIKHGGFNGQSDYFDVKKISGHDVLHIDPEHFYRDFRNGIAKYLKDLKGSLATQSQLLINFETIFDDVFVNGN